MGNKWTSFFTWLLTFIGTVATESTVQGDKDFPMKDKRTNTIGIQNTTVPTFNSYNFSESGTQTLPYVEEEIDPDIENRVVVTETGKRDTASANIIHNLLSEDTITSKTFMRGGRDKLLFEFVFWTCCVQFFGERKKMFIILCYQTQISFWTYRFIYKFVWISLNNAYVSVMKTI